MADRVAVDPIVDRVRASIEHHKLIGDRARLVIAVSGGADSTCLLDVLARLHARLERVLVAHVDHGLRDDSSEDAHHVMRLAAVRGLACQVVTVDVPAFAREHRLGIEHAARILRYRALAGLAAEHHASAVLTGHTLDDVAETVLLHLIRGSGMTGLAGLRPVEILDPGRLGPPRGQTGWKLLRVVRPLFEVRRFETAEYCVRHNIDWRSDPTNDDPRSLRNRIRLHLLPMLRTYNPSIEPALARTADLVREEDAWIDRLCARRLRRIARHESGRICVALNAWRRLPRPVARRMARIAAQSLGSDSDTLGHDAVERVLTMAKADHGSSVRLAQGLSVEYARGDLCFVQREPSV